VSSRIKPINLLDSSEFRPERAAVVDAIREVLDLAAVASAIPINDFGCWRHEHWRDAEQRLVPFLSVDWYVWNAWDEARAQVNAELLMALVQREPWRKKEMLGEHYDVLILDQDMYTMHPDWPDDFIVAMARPELGTVISTFRLKPDVFTLLKTVVMHQMGHVFGTPNQARVDVDREHGLHCANRCVMRYPEKTPEDWERLTLDRFKGVALCDSCIRDLKEYFESG